MFDWPLANHTSPTRTLDISSWLPATETFIVRFSHDASIGSRRTRHSPLASAFAVFDCPANSTVTASPGVAVPHTGTGTQRCITMLSANGAARRICAFAANPAHTAANIIKRLTPDLLKAIIP